jgi:hypothetical protein
MSLEIYQPTTEQLQHWEKLDELEKYAFAGIMSDEEQERRVNNLLEPKYFHRQLEKLRGKKQKLLEDLAWVEQREQLLLAVIDRREQHILHEQNPEKGTELTA